MARLKEKYRKEIAPVLAKEFGITNVMAIPKIEKIVLNMGIGEAIGNSKILDTAVEELKSVTGQKPVVTKAKKSIAAFKLREEMPVGASVTLRGARAYEFTDRLTSVALPRVRDFRGLKSTSFDGMGNYSMGIKEQIIFPEIDYDAVDTVRGLDVTFTTTATTNEECYALLEAFGMPFSKENNKYIPADQSEEA